jgi:hypothetical protein
MTFKKGQLLTADALNALAALQPAGKKGDLVTAGMLNKLAANKIQGPGVFQTAHGVFQRPIARTGSGGWPIPLGVVAFLDATSRVLTRAAHQCMWLFLYNNGDPPSNTPGHEFDIVLPPNPTVGDFYFFMCYNHGNYYVHIYGNNTVSQKIIMPSEEWAGTGRAIALDYNGTSAWPGGMNQLILACNAANQWICVDSQHSNIFVGALP